MTRVARLVLWLGIIAGSLYVLVLRSTSALLEPGDPLSDHAAFETLAPYVDERALNVFTYLDRVSWGCRSGQIVAMLDSLDRVRSDVRTHIVMSRDYTSTDVQTVNANYDLRPIFVRASLPLHRLARGSAARGQTLSGMTLVVNRQGVVEHALAADSIFVLETALAE